MKGKNGFFYSIFSMANTTQRAFSESPNDSVDQKSQHPSACQETYFTFVFSHIMIYNWNDRTAVGHRGRIIYKTELTI